jgi:hypothetical protein
MSRSAVDGQHLLGRDNGLGWRNACLRWICQSDREDAGKCNNSSDSCLHAFNSREIDTRRKCFQRCYNACMTDANRQILRKSMLAKQKNDDDVFIERVGEDAK